MRTVSSNQRAGARVKELLILGAVASALTLSACASFSTDPEAANQRVRQLCYVRDADWVQIAPPENAQAYRDAWTAAAGHEQFWGSFNAPQWPEDEFWFRRASGEIKLCTGNPFYRKERCGAGTTVDFAETATGLVASNYEEPVCLT